MTEEAKKTGLTEAGIAITVVGILETAQRFLLDNPLVPDPWGPVVLSVIGLGVVVARVFVKRSAA